MAPPRSRMRRQKRKKIDHTPCLLLFLSLALVFTFYLSSVIIDDGDFHVDDPEQDMVSHCRESCSAVILSPEEIQSATSPGSLAFSAVDALFSFREVDEEVHSSATKKQQNQRGTQSPSFGQGKNIIPRQNNIYRNMNSQPTRLPPLIATLVGKIDGHEDFEITPQGNVLDVGMGTTSNRSDRIHNPNGNEIGISSGSGDDSVAMVAAAAAAALWSESRQGRLRMKTFNDEWESSLRWIASWGQQSHDNKSTTKRSKSPFRSSQKTSKGSTNKSRDKGIALAKESEMHFKTAENSRFSELLNACVEQCTGGTIPKLKKSSTIENPSPGGVADGLNMNLTATMNALNSISTSFVCLMYYFQSLQANKLIMKSLFSVAVSTAVMLGIRNVFDWWRRKTSLRLLLEEEKNQEKIDCDHNRKKGKAIGKKVMTKKIRQKKKEYSQIVKDNNTDYCIDAVVNRDGHKDVSMRSDSSESMSFSELNQVDDKTSKKCVDDNPSSDQGSKDYASLMSTPECFSLHGDGDDDDEYCVVQAASNIAKFRAETTTPLMRVMKQHKSRRKKSSVTRSLKILPRRMNLAQAPSIRKDQDEIKNHIPNSTHARVTTQVTDIPMKSAFDAASIITSESLSVPTEEQREKASRLLREYQLTQVQKYVRSKKARSNAPDNSIPRIANIYDPLQGNTCEMSRIYHSKQSPGKKRMDLFFNPGSPVESDALIHTDMVSDRTLDAGAGVDQSILSMLDESDEEVECELTPSKKTIEFSDVVFSEGLIGSPINVHRKTPKRQHKVRSIALGGLLTSENNTSSSVSSNPWCTTNGTFRNDSPTVSLETLSLPSQESERPSAECTDANICLQVSAREFSPSGDRGLNGGNYGHAW